LGCMIDVVHAANLGLDLGIVNLLRGWNLEGRSSSSAAGGTGGRCAC
jgi:hypothetical protein